MPIDEAYFNRCTKIRRGELDSEMPGYEELTGWLLRVPLTWLPGLLMQAVVCCLSRKCFKEGGLIEFVSQIESQWNSPGHGILRDDQPKE